MRPTTDDLEAMTIDLVMGRRKMRESSIPLIHRAYRQAWRSVKADVKEAERKGHTIVLPD